MEKSLRVAIVDDLTEDSQRLADYLEQFQREHNMEIKMDVYNASFEFLEKYHGNYDVIFLDIEMPGSDGLEVAREIPVSYTHLRWIKARAQIEKTRPPLKRLFVNFWNPIL